MGSRFYKSLSQAGSRHQRKENTVLFWLRCSASRLHFVPHSLEGDMKPIGKVLCATGVVAGLIAFFWKDDFNPGRLARGMISS